MSNVFHHTNTYANYWLELKILHTKPVLKATVKGDGVRILTRTLQNSSSAESNVPERRCPMTFHTQPSSWTQLVQSRAGHGVVSEQSAALSTDQWPVHSLIGEVLHWTPAGTHRPPPPPPPPPPAQPPHHSHTYTRHCCRSFINI